MNSASWVTGVSPDALGMPIVKGGPIAVAADRKSFSIKAAGNWTWTYTPTLVSLISAGLLRNSRVLPARPPACGR